MPDKKISDLTATTTVGDTDLLTTVQSGVNKKITGANLKTEINSSNVFTNAETMSQQVGAYDPGTTFTDQTMDQMWNGLLYFDPTFASFSISGQATTVEVGELISGAQTFIWTTTNSSKIQANSIDIEDITGSANLFTGLANDGTEAYDFTPAITKTTNGNYRWRIIGTNLDLATFQRNYDVNFWWRVYWGISASTTLNEAGIKALANSQLYNGAARTYSFGAGDYKHFAWPSSFSQPDYTQDFKDASSGFAVAMEAPYTVSVTNVNGQTTNYEVYRTTNILASTINITVSV